MVGPLHKKLLRDLRDLKGPILTIAVVVGCGVSAFISLAGTHRVLVQARASYYTQSRMGDVFASVERAPESLSPRLAALPGVSRVQTRVRTGIRVPMPGLSSAADGVAISIPRQGPARLGELMLTAGRRPRAGHHDEVLLLDAFAKAHSLAPGATLRVVLEGQERVLRAVGFATSAEWVMTLVPGSMAPDDRRFAVVWMPRDALASAAGMEGAFNDLVIETQAHASVPALIAHLDRLLEPYGAPGAYGIDRQPSHYFLTQELQQLEGMANFAPFLFLAVAAFLLNVVLARIVALQRGVIATLKALGYYDTQIALHYLELVILIVLFGAALGVSLGALMGQSLTQLYLGYYHLPPIRFSTPLDLLAAGTLTALLAGVVGGLGAVRGVLRMTPAEAMRPPSPANYSGGGAMPHWLRQAVAPAVRMVYRELRRQPVRTALSVLAIGMSVGLVVLGAAMSGAMGKLLDEYMPSVQREDLTVGLRAPVPAASLSSFRAIPGVRRAEGLRSLPVRFEAGAHQRSASINAYPSEHGLRPLRDLDGQEVHLPATGILLTDVLADRLGLRPGDHVRVVVLEGERRVLSIPVAGTLSEAMGMAGHMHLAELHRRLREPETINQVLLTVDPRERRRVVARVDEMPMVASAGSVAETIEAFSEQSGQSMTVFAIIIGLFAGAITIGVVYNNARISLNSRQRDLASMRILGFTKAEISSVLLGEMTVQVVLALPVGLWLGKKMLEGMMADVDPETFRMPLEIQPSAYVIASLVTILAAFAAALIVRRRLDHLDLIAVLKTRE